MQLPYSYHMHGHRSHNTDSLISISCRLVMRNRLESNLDGRLCIINRRRIRGKQLGNGEMRTSTNIICFEQGLCLLTERESSLAIFTKGLQEGTICKCLSKHILLLMPLFGNVQRRQIFPLHCPSKCVG